MKNNTRNYFSFILLYIFSTFVYGGNFNQSAVVTAHQIATRTGLEILKKGGNAFDAAAAITASNAVCIGYRAIRNLGGAYNKHTVVGAQSCGLTTSGNEHTAFGYRTLYFQSSGQRKYCNRLL